ncbi:unnamed protein product [Anisakis simplex]|uniref:GATA zinc finger domain-containing protein 14 n=1 Tax=Anisakis simplex TaxID=6269 RepID=A0A0M3JL38_ANISI|nr:unnamed protein product [Anisakis simplex]
MLGKRSQQQQQQAGGGGVVGKANNAGGGYYRETVTPPACFTVGACNSYNKTMMTGMSNSAHTTPQKMSNHNRNHNHHNNHHHRNHNNNNNRMLTVRSAAALNIQPVVSAQQLDQLETCQTAMARQVSCLIWSINDLGVCF